MDRGNYKVISTWKCVRSWIITRSRDLSDTKMVSGRWIVDDHKIWCPDDGSWMITRSGVRKMYSGWSQELVSGRWIVDNHKICLTWIWNARHDLCCVICRAIVKIHVAHGRWVVSCCASNMNWRQHRVVWRLNITIYVALDM
jgi:hypothetical protein